MQESHFWVFCLETLAEELEKIKNVKTKGGAKQLKVYLVTGYARVRLASFVEWKACNNELRLDINDCYKISLGSVSSLTNRPSSAALLPKSL